MANESTGKTRGRPKTKEYRTLLARVPAELAELVKRYADQHRLSVATVIREGIEWRIGDGDPRGNGVYLGQPTSHSEIDVLHDNTLDALLKQIQADNERMLQAVLQSQDAHLQALLQSLTPNTQGESDSEHKRNTRITEVDGDIPAASIKAQQTPTASRSVPYDTSKHHLGKLCPRGHNHEGTGQSLRNADNQCLECKAQEKREKRAKNKAKREAKAVAGGVL